ncbi:Putative fungal transcription factor [Septoria linicola]|uniref:Fungal transcription factor n=1 Tax=Septoria linicola TaxID=215465 RepID=A0A9Q9EPZ9_9PEZI|nr:putative fungal transcription factor [Septoria linicola]USW58262.1 Putative fungal transcription factor [Septoria linicola]
MFQLFTPAFIEFQAGINLLDGNLEIYLDWLLSHQISQPGLSDLVVTYKSAIELARDIYLMERTQGSEREPVQAKISCLGELTASIGAQTPGMHCLVWPYFIAGASSILPEDRQYFEAKLDQIHQQTRMRNIVVAMESLRDIWRQHPTGGWALHLDRLRPVLAI